MSLSVEGSRGERVYDELSSVEEGSSNDGVNNEAPRPFDTSSINRAERPDDQPVAPDAPKGEDKGCFAKTKDFVVNGWHKLVDCVKSLITWIKDCICCNKQSAAQPSEGQEEVPSNEGSQIEHV